MALLREAYSSIPHQDYRQPEQRSVHEQMADNLVANFPTDDPESMMRAVNGVSGVVSLKLRLGSQASGEITKNAFYSALSRFSETQNSDHDRPTFIKKLLRKEKTDQRIAAWTNVLETIYPSEPEPQARSN